jgi:ATP-binding cassette subfamily B protein RaxB
VLTTPEANKLPTNDLAHLEPSVALKGVSFRYGEGEPWILKKANLRLKAGQSVAIIGPSGCGKTTLGKVPVPSRCMK